MSKSARGDVVYKCDTCKRKTRVPLNIYGFDVVQRCIITENCLGKLHLVSTTQEINSTPAFPPEVIGLQDWFQRKVLFTFSQTIQSDSWTVKHDLETKPLVQVVVHRVDGTGNQILTELAPSDFEVVVIDLNNIQIIFEKPESGVAQCIGVASANKINPPTTQIINTPDTLLTNAGEITIATTSNTPAIVVNAVFKTVIQDVIVAYSSVNNVPSVLSPWVGTNIVHIGGKNFTVRSFNILTSFPAPDYFEAGLINDGSPLYFSNFSEEIGQNFILLGNFPFSTVDRTTDAIIDIATINQTNPQIYYNKGKVYSNPNVTKSIYPPIFTVV